MKRFLLLSFTFLGLSLPAFAFAEPPILLMDIGMHDLDEEILASMGYDTGSVVYFRELGSINQQQLDARKLYEPVGCDPFYLMRNGEVSESGFNCHTFFCVGYLTGPKICSTRDGETYGGVVEINRRVNLPYYKEPRMLFESFESGDQTDYMKTQMRVFAALRCRPFYQMRFDMAVGEGIDCEEVGEYPYYSSENECVDDWRNANGLECRIPLRDNEFEIRRQAIVYREGGSGSVIDWEDDIETGTGSSSSVASSSSSSSVATVYFPDVVQGRYGYTAIMDLSARGIVKGYDDGTFRPSQTVNRAEFAKIFVGGLFSAEISGETFCFPDVTDAWYSAYVCAAKRRGWLQGYADGSFRASSTMNKAEAMKVVVASLGVPLSSTGALPPGTDDGQWYSPYIRKALELKLILEPFFDPRAHVTRADVAVWIYRARKGMGV